MRALTRAGLAVDDATVVGAPEEGFLARTALRLAFVDDDLTLDEEEALVLEGEIFLLVEEPVVAKATLEAFPFALEAILFALEAILFALEAIWLDEIEFPLEAI